MISDHAMMGWSGLDLVRAVRASGFAGEIIVVTGYMGTFDENQYRALKVASVMPKPYDVPHLLQWLAYMPECRERWALGEAALCPPEVAANCWVCVR
jgi:CheY-like chemotaxis protein